MALGATSAKIEISDYKIIHKWANDYDKDTCNTYTRNSAQMMERVYFVEM